MPTEDDSAALAIANLVSRYCDAVAGGDEAAFRSCWAADARWTGPGLDQTGVDAIVRAWSKMRARLASAVQQVESGTVEVSGEAATGTWWIREHVVPIDGKPRDTVGRYDDEYVLEEAAGDAGGWRFRRRTFTPAGA